MVTGASDRLGASADSPFLFGGIRLQVRGDEAAHLVDRGVVTGRRAPESGVEQPGAHLEGEKQGEQRCVGGYQALLDEVAPEPFRLRLVEGAHQFVECGVTAREPEFRAAPVAAEVAEKQVDHDVDGLAQGLRPGFGQGVADEPVQLVQVPLQQLGIDLVPVGEVVYMEAIGIPARSPVAFRVAAS